MNLTRLALVMALACRLAEGAEGNPGDASRFDASVATILAERCLDCHSGGDAKGGLDLSSRAAAFRGGDSGGPIVAGEPGESLLWEKVESDEMPPKAPLSDAEKSALKGWIEEGAAWGTDPIDPYIKTTGSKAGRDWWSLQPVRRATPPEAAPDGTVRNPVDAWVLRGLGARGLRQAPEAGRRELIRRLSFDLTGLPPRPDDVQAFLDDPSELAYENLVERYLASPQYGVRWARWWLDLARFAESDGFEYDEFRPNAWRYRDWVVRALNDDMPYDEFARRQIAGDVLAPSDPGAIEATGFLVAGAFDKAGQNQISAAMKAVVRADELEDIIGTVGQTFLGLTVHCARCHDHKFDPIRQAEYYRFASALGGVRQGERELYELTPRAAELELRRAEIQRALDELEAPARAEVVASRTATPAGEAPAPAFAWDFDRGLRPKAGGAGLLLRGDAQPTADGLRLDGKSGYAITGPVDLPLEAKTIEAWVKLDNLDQRGGGVISILDKDGAAFDAIVFGEQEPGRWLAGSENFARTRPVGGPAEAEAASAPVHCAIRYAEDGTIQVFRDGKPYGAAYQSPGPLKLVPGGYRVAFGIRHLPEGGNRMLAGTIVRARVYDRALTDREIEASRDTFRDYINEEMLLAAMSDGARRERAALVEQFRSLQAEREQASHRAHVVVPREDGVTRVQLRGNPAQPGEIVRPGGIASLVGPEAAFGLEPDAPEGQRRIALARWISSPANPLFARVVVNRIWQGHFGAGLVEAASDFGFNGGRPSHPELLDWLAGQLVEQGWSLKAIHRLIVNSATYRQSSAADEGAMAGDANNRMLWRKAPLRLEAEMVRDAMYEVAGRLDPRLGGESFQDRPRQVAPGTPATLYAEADPAGPGLNRRTLYRAWARGGRSAFLDALDCPDPSTTTPRRSVTTTPLQALSMMNNALVLHLSDEFAARLAREAGRGSAEQVDLAYRLAFSRRPSPEELDSAVRVVEGFGAATLARAIFNSSEFLYVD